MYIRYFWQGDHQIYGHIQCIYTVLANPTYKPSIFVSLLPLPTHKFCSHINFSPSQAFTFFSLLPLPTHKFCSHNNSPPSQAFLVCISFHFQAIHFYSINPFPCHAVQNLITLLYACRFKFLITCLVLVHDLIRFPHPTKPQSSSMPYSMPHSMPHSMPYSMPHSMPH